MRWILIASALAGAPAWAADIMKDAPNEVVITASPFNNADRLATIVQTVNRDDILKSGGASLAGALSGVPGVSDTGFASGASRPVIRGMDANRVKILEDGVGSSDVSDIGPDHGVPIDPLSAQKIEVVRGAATLRFGSQAIGGVVNAINNRVPLSLPSDPLKGEASLSADSVADTKEGSALLDGRLGRFAFHADGFERRTDDYDTPLGIQANSFFQGGGYALGSSYIFPKDGHLGATLIQYNAKYGIPSDTTFIDMRQTKGLVSGLFHIDQGAVKSLSVDLGAAHYKHDEKDPDGTILSTFKNQEYDGRTELVLGQMGWLSSSALGFQVTSRKFSAGGEGADYLSPTLSQSGAVFVFTEAPLGEKLHLQAGARGEKAEISGIPASNIPVTRDFAPISGSFGVLWDTTDNIKLGLSLASAARAPAQTELFARGPHDGPGTFETGDPNLTLERANSIEGTLRVRAARFRAEGSVWGARFSNFIYGQLSGRTCDDDGTCFSDDTHDLKELNYTSADAKFWGAEAKASYDLFRVAGGQLELDGLADMVRADFVGGGPVPRIQPYRAGAGLSWSNDNVDAGFMYVHVGAQDRVPLGDTVTPGHASLDAHASWKPFTGKKSFEIALIGQNLTDDIRRNAVALNRDEVVMPGRNVRLVLRQSF